MEDNDDDFLAELDAMVGGGTPTSSPSDVSDGAEDEDETDPDPVSYTHLTLPTICSV